MLNIYGEEYMSLSLNFACKGTLFPTLTPLKKLFRSMKGANGLLDLHLRL